MKKNKGNKNKTGKVIGVIALAIILGSVFFQGVSGSLEDNKKDKNNEERETVKDDSAYVNIEFIGYNEFKTLYDGSDKTILVLGQKGCGYCDKYKPVLDEIAEEENIKINYLDIRALGEQEKANLMSDLDSYFKDNSRWGTPLTLVLENQTVVDSLAGYNAESKTLEFYKENNIVK